MFYLLLMTFVNGRRFYVQRKRADVWALLSSAGSRFFLTHDIGNRVQQRFRVRIDVKISAVSRAIIVSGTSRVLSRALNWRLRGHITSHRANESLGTIDSVDKGVGIR